ncbi:MAG: L-serine ammonia-lyase, iron-sulfur-dependent, subunit alpha, partial [Desulfotignum sp.]
MERTDARYRAYLTILQEELVPAMGCTEPIAVAYAAARAAAVLGCLPDRVIIEASDNIVKNVKSVVVPNTGGLRGLAAAAAAGIAAGDADQMLEVIANVDAAGQERIRQFLGFCDIQVRPLANGILFDLKVTVFKGAASAMVQISHFHTNIVWIEKDGGIVYRNQDCDEVNTTALTDRSLLNVKDIVDFAASVPISDVADLLQKMVDLNMAIAEQGVAGNWGANIGKVLLDVWGDDVKIRAKALAAAGSDARMSGCELPVVIVSGSGNQSDQAAAVTGKSRDFRDRWHMDGDAPVTGICFQKGQHLGDHLFHIHRLHAGFHMPGKIQQLPGNGAAAFHRFQHILGKGKQPLVRPGLLFQGQQVDDQPGFLVDDIQGVVDFMGHTRCQAADGCQAVRMLFMVQGLDTSAFRFMEPVHQKGGHAHDGQQDETDTGAQKPEQFEPGFEPEIPEPVCLLQLYQGQVGAGDFCISGQQRGVVRGLDMPDAFRAGKKGFIQAGPAVRRTQINRRGKQPARVIHEKQIIVHPCFQMGKGFFPKDSGAGHPWFFRQGSRHYRGNGVQAG